MLNVDSIDKCRGVERSSGRTIEWTNDEGDGACDNDKLLHEEPLDTYLMQVCPVLPRTDLSHSHAFLRMMNIAPASIRMALDKIKHALGTDPDSHRGPGGTSVTRCPQRRE
jgi:hypothetical protein